MSKNTFQCKNVFENSSTDSRYVLIGWINAQTKYKYKKIEELRTGLAYCKLMYLLFPGSIAIRRVRTDSKFEYEFLNNFRVFQAALVMVGCSKRVPIDRLVKGTFYQDNLYFLQWFKKFFDANYRMEEGEGTSSAD